MYGNRASINSCGSPRNGFDEVAIVEGDERSMKSREVEEMIVGENFKKSGRPGEGLC
jgi:hypothetical protein